MLLGNKIGYHDQEKGENIHIVCFLQATRLSSFSQDDIIYKGFGKVR